MIDFEVTWCPEYFDYYKPRKSKVYAVDPVNNRFLVVINHDGFLDWIPIDRCQVVPKEKGEFDG